MLQFIVDLLQDAALLVSIFTIVGNIALKKSYNDIIISTVKTYLGFTLLFAGASLMISPALDSFSKIFIMAFNIEGIIPNNEVISVEAMQKLGSIYTSSIAVGLIGAMLFNILLARITSLKYIVLSGHHVFFMVSCLTIICMLHKYSIYTSAFFAAMITGIWCVISPAMLVGYCRQIKNCDELRKLGDFSIGQFGSTSYFLAGWLGNKFGNKGNDAERINIPVGIGFLQDKQVSTFLLMLLFFIISTLIAGVANVQAAISTKGHHVNILTYLLKQAGMFSAGVYVLTRGVGMFIEQLIPAFKGISDKIVKNSIPAVEIYSLFPYSSNAVFIGFVCCTLSGFITMIALPFVGYPVMVPSLLFTFASGGGAGIIGNATGGLRGAIIGSVVCGIISIAGSALIYQPIRDAGVTSPTTFSTTDFTLLGVSLHSMLSVLH
ncbi:PTS transporter subunit IIC [Pseudescherichia sp.]|uniref:PTS transporter subunit IIC n=1 Tax=Pseudescherichia sp. TaxID=2055881 RepID=UPI002898207E|nr:PTS transporter subunit IIC [Pseudescherichia sp.]